MGTFEAFYASELQHPWLLWAAAALALGFCLTRAGLDASVRRYCTLLAGLSFLDAWLTSSHVYGVGSLSGSASSFVPLFFVLAGDLRFLLLFGIATATGAIALRGGALAAAAALTLLVPLLTQLILSQLPESMSGARILFFVYEVLFVGLTLALLRLHPRVGEVPWLTPVCRFVLIYYGLWASADAILLATGSDLGFALRVVPNLLYYGGLIAVIGWAASRARPMAAA
jgi:hypothetical protein